jgi:hypothetical protein
VSARPPNGEAGGGLRRVLGRAFAASAAIGTTIGGGILYTPGKIAALLPSPGWILGIWAFGGVNALLERPCSRSSVR